MLSESDKQELNTLAQNLSPEGITDGLKVMFEREVEALLHFKESDATDFAEITMHNIAVLMAAISGYTIAAASTRAQTG
jgi:hypothetical protein